jgi:hypothetical protein
MPWFTAITGGVIPANGHRMPSEQIALVIADYDARHRTTQRDEDPGRGRRQGLQTVGMALRRTIPYRDQET